MDVLALSHLYPSIIWQVPPLASALFPYDFKRWSAVKHEHGRWKLNNICKKGEKESRSGGWIVVQQIERQSFPRRWVFKSCVALLTSESE
jgi:hypothetical protein